MRDVAVAVFLVSTLVSCKESAPAEVQPETRDEAAEATANQVPTTKLVGQSRPGSIAPAGPIAPADDALPRTPTHREPVAEQVPTSPFLVPATPTQRSTADAFAGDPLLARPAPPPPLPPRDTIERPPPPGVHPPPPAPRPWPPSGNNTGKPCPVGRCLLNGKCVIPGGPIGHPGLPPDAVVTACGGDGGPCSRCRCVSTGTLLSTPQGETPIEDLRTNDIVWSIHQGRRQAVPILATQRVRVHDHSMARVHLKDGFVLEISGEHPVGDGRNLWSMKPGDVVGNAQIAALEVVPYEGTFTYDILPDSDTGTYFVHGMWLGSTMFGQRVRGDVIGESQD